MSAFFSAVIRWRLYLVYTLFLYLLIKRQHVTHGIQNRWILRQAQWSALSTRKNKSITSRRDSPHSLLIFESFRRSSTFRHCERSETISYTDFELSIPSFFLDEKRKQKSQERTPTPNLNLAHTTRQAVQFVVHTVRSRPRAVILSRFVYRYGLLKKYFLYYSYFFLGKRKYTYFDTLRQAQWSTLITRKNKSITSRRDSPHSLLIF